MDYMELQWQWYGVLNGSGFEAAYEALTPYLGAGGEVRGFGLTLYASGLFSDSHANALRCLSLLDEALPLLRDQPGLTMFALIEASRISDFAMQTEVAKRTCQHLRAMMESPGELAKPWVGRGMLNVGRHYWYAEDYDAAALWFTDAIKWHQQNAGPYARWSPNERDRKCYLRMSISHLCSAQVMAGHHKAAAKNLEQIVKDLSVEWVEATAIYLRSLLDALNGKHNKALSGYQQAETLASKANDHELAMNAAKDRARLLCKMGRREEAIDILNTLIERYAQGGMVTLVLHLQKTKRSLA